MNFPSSVINYVCALIVVFGTVSSPQLFAEEENERMKLNAGPGKAVLEATKERGLRLSGKAIRTAELKLAPAPEGKVIEVPLSSVVFFQDFTGIYRVRDGWFKLIELDLIKQTKTHASFQSKDLDPKTDRIVTHGVSYLRATDMDIWGPQSDSCVD